MASPHASPPSGHPPLHFSSLVIGGRAMAWAEVATLERTDFIGIFGGLFEQAPWVAELAWARRPFANEAALHEALMASLRGASAARQMSFLRAQPELVGQEAEPGTLGPDSSLEPQDAALSELTRNEFFELQRLNAGYARRHGFPFVTGAEQRTKRQIFAALRVRTGKDTAHEIEEALRQIGEITRRRLRAMFELG